MPGGLFVVLSLFESFANTIFDRKRSVDTRQGGGGFFERKTKSNQGIESLIMSRLSGNGEFRLSGTIMTGQTDLVSKINNDTLSGFFANTGGLGDKGGIGIGNGIAHFLGVAKAKDTHSGFGADTIHSDEHLKKALGGEARETIQFLGCVANGMIGIEFDLVMKISAFGVGNRDGDLITNAMHINNDGGGEFFSNDTR